MRQCPKSIESKKPISAACQLSGTKSGDKACMLALPRDVCRVGHGVCTVTGAGDSAKMLSRLSQLSEAVMEFDHGTLHIL